MSSLNKAADLPVEKRNQTKNLQLEGRAAARITDEREWHLLLELQMKGNGTCC